MPLRYAFSADGRRLIIGAGQRTAFYDIDQIRRVDLTFSQSDRWNRLRSNYSSGTDIPARLSYDGTELDYDVGIRFNEIKYIEGMREYVRIHLTDGNPVMTLLSMKALEEKLPPQQFMRVHRSYIVNLNKINVIERNRIVFDTDVYIPVSEQYKEAFQGFLGKCLFDR